MNEISPKVSTKLNKDAMDLYIANFRFAIESQSQSFAAMDTKSSILLSVIVIIAILIIEMTLNADINDYHQACQFIIYIFGGWILFSTTVNVLLGCYTLKGRNLKCGILDANNVANLNHKRHREEILGQLSQAYDDNKKQYDDKNKYFERAQGFGKASIISYLVFVLLLSVLQLIYG